MVIEGWLRHIICDEELEENVNISFSYRVFKYGFKPFKNIFGKALSLPQFKIIQSFWDYSLDHSHEGQAILKVRFMVHEEDKAC